MTTDGGPGDLASILDLADWRRSVAALYAEVRRLVVDDQAAALAHWRTTREALYREHPQSPVLPSERATFRARHFDHDPALRFEVRVEEPAGDGPTAPPGLGALGGLSIELPVSVGGAMSFRRIGTVEVPFDAGIRRLELYWMAGYAGGLFLPFRDATNGSETYGAGRYLLDAAKSADLGGDCEAGTLVLDFNFAYHPSCTYDAAWACPLAPPGNVLDLDVPVGEQLPPGGWY
jgi:uncharacterized protein (DUF1684 family)